MALQVWLPLNGDINNQGLNPISMVGSPNSWGNGKIGKCATFSPTSTTPTTKIYNTTTSLNYVNEDFSWSVWINPSSTIYGTSYIFTVGRADAGGYGYGMGVYSGSVYCWFGNKNWSVSITHNVWTHISFCRKGNTIKLYKNGVLDSTQTFSGTLPTYSDGNGLGLGCFHYSGSIYAYNGSINDFRIYNHCLSPKEVKEISKGLVLHYKMDDGYIESTTNLAPYPTPGSTVNPGWDTSKHPNAISVSGWGSGYNGGVGSPEKGYHACWNVIDGIPTIVYRNLNSEIGAANRWLGVSSDNVTISSGTKYTISYEAKSTSGSGQIGAGIYYNNGSSTNFHDGCPYVTVGREWKKYSYTLTAKSAVSGSIYIYGYSGTEGINYVRNFQLELKDHATPYTPTSRSETTVYDCSGFGYNGIAYGNLITDSDTSRYSSSIKFPVTTTDYIEMNNSSVFSSLDNCTISWWGKYDGTRSLLLTGQSTGYYVAAGEPGFYHSNVTGTLSYYVDGVKSSSVPSYTSGQWHHYTITGVNITSWTKFLLNHYGDHTQWGIQGKISDFRIYATPLSAEDVKELYNTSAMVCDNGTVMAYSLEE